MRGKSIAAVVLLCILEACVGYKPVIMMHGLLGDEMEFYRFRSSIEQAHPGTNVTLIAAFSNASSVWTNLWAQVDTIGQIMQSIMEANPDGVNLVCYSQGGIICRGIIETFNNHNVHNFVALSSPLMGQFGATYPFSKFFPTWATGDLYKLFYKQLAQDHISIANYWNDPFHQEEYLAENIYLPVLNNQTANSKSQAYKDNFTRLNKLVAIGGPDDRVITPWQSSQFGVYDKSLNVTEMRKQEMYVKDWFGLQTLDQRGDLHFHTFPHIHHEDWHLNPMIFKCCILPYLD